MGARRRASFPSSDLSTPFSFRKVDDLGLRAELLEEAEGARGLGEPDDRAVRVVEVAERHRLGRAALDARRHVVPFRERAPLEARLVLRPLESVVAEAAL